MTERKWMIAGGALLLLGAAWLVRSTSSAPRAPRSALPEAPARAPDAESTPKLAQVEQPLGARSAVVERTVEGEIGDGPERTFEIRVVMGATRAPVPGAEVFLIDVVGQGQLPDNWFLVDEELEANGQPRRTDEEGRVRVEPPSGPCYVAARSGAGFAGRKLDAGEPGPIVLALEPDPPVRVQVVDRAGLPVSGAPVAVRYALFAGALIRATTREDGTAELFARGLRRAPMRHDTFVGLSTLLAEPVEVAVDLEHPPPQPIVLVMPATGSLEVALVDESGKPFREAAQVRIERSTSAPAAADAERDLFAGWRGAADPLVQETRDGRALFPWVGLGLELGIRAEPLREDEESRVTTHGPEMAGQHLEVRLEVRAGPVLYGRILDPERRPIASAQLMLRVDFEGGGMGATCVTDAAGRFRGAFAIPDFETLEATELALTARRVGGEAYHGRIDRPRFGKGETDLGDVVLALSPLAVRGTVVDEEGKPVLRARVRFLRDATPGPGSSGTRLGESLTDARGRFEWKAELEADSIGLQVEADGFARADIQVVPVGTDGLRFELARGGWLTGLVLLTTPDWPTLELWKDGEATRASRSMSGAGSFRFGPLPAGTYSLSCGYPWSEERSWVDGLRIEAGREATDPRLDPLDLRAFLPVIGLTIVDREGRNVPGPVILLARAGSGEFVYSSPGREGERWLVLGTPPLRIRVEAAGFRAQELEGVDSDRTVVLQPGIPVRLEFVGPLPELPAGWELRGELMRQSFGATTAGADRPARLREQSFPLTDGRVEPWLAEPGGYLFSFVVARSRETAGWSSTGQSSSFWDEPQPVLEIRDDGTLQAFELRAPSEATLREMLDYISKQAARFSR